jgi:hypothetical protein
LKQDELTPSLQGQLIYKIAKSIDCKNIWFTVQIWSNFVLRWFPQRTVAAQFYSFFWLLCEGMKPFDVDMSLHM